MKRINFVPLCFVYFILISCTSNFSTDIKNPESLPPQELENEKPRLYTNSFDGESSTCAYLTNGRMKCWGPRSLDFNNFLDAQTQYIPRVVL